MGVLRFFRYLTKKYNDVIIPFNNPFYKDRNTNKIVRNNKVNNIYSPECEILLLDLNAIFHPCCQKVFEYNIKDSQKSLILIEKKKNMSMEELEKWAFNSICSKIDELVRIANPIKCLYLAIDGVPGMCKQAQQRQRRFKGAKTALDNPYGFNSNCITTGTEFMDRLGQHLYYYIQKKKNNDWKGLKIIYNNQYVPGEGEHKLIRYLEDNKTYNNVTVMSPDADLIMLCLTLKKKKINILRENIFDDIQGGYVFVDINKLKECILNEISCENIEHPFNIDFIIRDYVFFLFMIGNDFLPNMPSLEISNKGIEILLSTYSKVYMNHGYLIKDLANNLYLNKASFINLLEELSNLEIMMILEKYNKGYAKHPDRLLIKHILRTEQGNNINFIEYRKDYYKTKLEVSEETLEEEVEEICRDYIKGMKFVLLYYFKSIPTFDYCYERHYAPFFSDLLKIAKKMEKENDAPYYLINFKPVKPLGIYESLIGILPPSSFSLLPNNISEEISKKILLDSDFLEEFEIDLEGKINDYEAILLLPFISYTKIKRLFKTVRLTPEQENKNKIGVIFNF